MLAGILLVLLVILIFVIVLYVLQGIFLFKFNKLVYGRGTALAWLPICNIYLLGKLTFNSTVGWCFVVMSFLTTRFSITIDGVEKTYAILPQSICSLYSVVVLGVFVYAIAKYVELKKSVSVESQQVQGMTQSQNVVQNNQVNNMQQTQNIQQSNQNNINNQDINNI